MFLCPRLFIVLVSLNKVVFVCDFSSDASQTSGASGQETSEGGDCCGAARSLGSIRSLSHDEQQSRYHFRKCFIRLMLLNDCRLSGESGTTAAAWGSCWIIYSDKPDLSLCYLLGVAVQPNTVNKVKDGFDRIFYFTRSENEMIWQPWSRLVPPVPHK